MIQEEYVVNIKKNDTEEYIVNIKKNDTRRIYCKYKEE